MNRFKLRSRALATDRNQEPPDFFALEVEVEGRTVDDELGESGEESPIVIGYLFVPSC